MTTIIDMIRHGEPEGGNRYRGHSIDDPLSEKGWLQMWQAVENRPVWDQVITSPMQRCKAFAEAYADKHQLPVIEEPRLVEIGFGAWEGLTSAEILATDKEAITRFYQDPVNNQPEGAERLRAFQSRVNDSLQDMLKQQAGKKTLLVVHAGVMRAAICAMTLSPLLSMYRMSIGNAAIIRIKDDGIRPATVIFS